ncbi:MAG: PAS domain-containing protein [Gemmatimonadaceae bacterium]|nr:PAS domain-containing protein [Gemmatimonadaceae bacterium]
MDTDNAPRSSSLADSIFPAQGEMGPLCRAKNWGETPLGPVETWPESLKAAAALVAHQGIAMNLCWGPELRQIYNDAYRTIMGDKHPAGLGAPVLVSWAEIRSEVEPLFARVMQGETVYFEDLMLRVDRHGVLEDASFTFSYSPVRIESGEVGAVLINCFETTAQVRARSVQAERDRLLAELDVERSRLSYVFNKAPFFLAVVRGPDHVFEMANDSYYQLVGHRDVIGKPVSEALPEVVAQGFIELLDGVLETGVPVVGREQAIDLQQTQGAPLERAFLDFMYIPFVEANGSRTGVIAHGVDVTAQVKARLEVERLLGDAEEARREAEQANRAKAEFLAAMSHELRTPLNAIGGYVELINMEIHGPVTEAQRDALNRVHASQRHLLTLINDILTHARLEAGRMEFDRSPVQVLPLLRDVETLIAPIASGKGIAYAIRECDPGLVLMADDERVRQIILNLVSNAVKFTDRGGTVTLACEPVGDRILLSVEDDGRGIPPEKLEAIFDPFMQVGRSLNRPEAGVGLGLAISRDLARGMWGELSVESEVGGGSTFTLSLPAA